MSDPKEYIDRGLYCETICRCNGTACDKSKCPIWNAPAADVAPVVRCKECVFYEEVEYYPDGTKKVCRLLKRQFHPDDFCSYGKRKENG